MKDTSVAIVGLGYVGLPLALLARSKNYSVLGIDFDESKIEKINKKVSPFVDADISEKLIEHPIKVQSNYKTIETYKTIIVCVPTPVDHDFIPDLGPVRAACMEIAKNLHKDQLIIIESTINPGVCDDVVIPLIEELSGFECGKDFYLAHCPERINPGDKKWNVSNIPRVVGANDEISLKRAVDFYESIIDAPIKAMESIKEAEAVKVVENSFRDVNIAFVNELAMSFSVLGIDVVNVIDGAATKPFAFMPHYPGAGVGGHCIPVDPYYLIEYAKSKGFSHRFLNVARDINNSMPNFVVSRLLECLEDSQIDIKDYPIGVLGLSYKPNVGDLRESPSLKIIDILLGLGAKVIAYDPYIDSKSAEHSLPKNVQVNIAKNQSSLIEDSLAVILATAHKDFLDIDYTFMKVTGTKIVVDGRNCLDKKAVQDAGIVYRGIGR